MQRRIFLLLLAFSAGLAMMTVRLFWIQAVASGAVIGKETGLVRRAVAQRGQTLVLDDGRGNFYYRNLRPITGQMGIGLAVFPVGSYRSDSEQEQISGILKVDRKEWANFIAGLKHPAFWNVSEEERPYLLSPKEADALARLGLPYLHVLPATVRYPEDMPAQQLIGYIAENPELVRTRYPADLAAGYAHEDEQIGVSGLEKTFDRYLRGIGSRKATLFTDGHNNPLSGLGLQMDDPANAFYPLQIITTLDERIQNVAEQALDDAHIREGTVVILAADNGDVLAMADRPQFDQYDVDPKNNNWQNRALLAAAPGSAFKTAVAAAALDAGVVKPEEEFFCGGELGEFGFSCWKQGGHGQISFAEAFAVSCNITFAKVAKRLRPEQIEAAANALGIGRTIGWEKERSDQSVFRQFDGESPGQVFDPRTLVDEGAKVQTAIGQRDVRMTPLQGANMVVALLNGGTSYMPRVVSEIRYANGLVKQKFPILPQTQSEAGAKISLRTARELVEEMQMTVESGTAALLRKAGWKAAGKTGTAQIFTQGGEMADQWFIGYFPADAPLFAISVLIQNRPEQSANLSLAVTKQIINHLAATLANP